MREQDAKAIVDEARKALVADMHRAGMLYVTEARKALNQAQPYRRYRGGKWFRGLNPSLPGQMPKKLRGELQRSIAYEVKSEGGNPVLYLGTNLRGHPAWLQLGTRRMAPRPWLTLVWQDIRQRVLALLGRTR